GGTRSYVWGPWFGCGGGTCEAIYQRIYNGSTLVNVSRDFSIGRYGGMEERQCSIDGVPGTFTCWYVDPARAQGLASWAKPSWGRSPVTKPFYVFDRAGREERHWLTDDTGYATGVRADKPITANARTALTWRTGEVLCDETAGRGTCDRPPPGPTLPDPMRHLGVSLEASGVPLRGDFDANGKQDVLWYAAGPASEILVKGGAFVTTVSLTVNYSYWPVVGDFNGDGYDDVFWYQPGSGFDYLWQGTVYGFLGRGAKADGDFRAFTGDFDGDGRADIFWYGPGADLDYLWFGDADGGFTGQGINETGDTTPVVGDYNDDGEDDVIWYGPGSSPDGIWYGRASRSFQAANLTVNGTYDAPLPGDYDGNGHSDVIWYGKGGRPDYLWRY
ncbi:MAG: VCBS repeat-containing protein, partial [Acidimicrobiales bacterium]|nr:VCBS repeat-containing protein [Acidimicrobiales bacterium]